MKAVPAFLFSLCIAVGSPVSCGPSYSFKDVTVGQGGLIETPGRDLVAREIGKDSVTIAFAGKDVDPAYQGKPGTWKLVEGDRFSVGNNVGVRLKKLDAAQPGEAVFTVSNLEHASWLVPPP